VRRPRRPRVFTGKARRAAGMILTGTAADRPCRVKCLKLFGLISAVVGIGPKGGGRREAFSHLTDIHILATIPEFGNIFFLCSTLPNRRSSMHFDGNLFCFWKFAEITALVLLYRRVKIYFLAHPARPLGPVRSYLTNGKLW